MYSAQKKYTFIAALLMNLITGGVLFGMEVKTTHPAVFEELPLELNRSIVLKWLERILGYNYRISTLLTLDGLCKSLISTCNPDLVVIATYDKVFLFNIRTEKIEKQFNAKHSIQQIAVNIESTKVAILQGKEIVLWDLSTEEKNVTLRADEDLRLVALSHDGKSILAISDQDVYLCDSSTKKLAKKYRVRKNSAVCSAAFNQKSNKILIATKNGEITIWDLQRNKLTTRIEYPSSITCALLSPDERSIVVAGREGITLFDSHTGNIRITNSEIGNTLSLACSHDGNTLVAGSLEKKVYVIDFKTAKVLTTLEHLGAIKSTSNFDSAITGVCFTSDGNNIISASRLGKLCLHTRLSNRLYSRRLKEKEDDNTWIDTRKETALELYLQLLGKPKQEALSISTAPSTNFYEELSFSVVSSTDYYQQLQNIPKDKAFLIFVILAMILGYNL